MGKRDFVRTSVTVVVLAIILNQVPKWLQRKLPNKGEGFAAPGWRDVADLFRSNLIGGVEKGGVVTVFHRGEMVVEFWGGYADYDADLPWQKDTLGQYCSAAKVVAAVCMARLVERGLLDYHRPVADYWPEFAASGKELITVEQLISHQAGLAIIDQTFSAFDILRDPEKLGQILAKQAPNWKPGSGHGYHGITFGLYVDQLVRRVDPLHRSLSQYFAEEIARPHGVDFYIGLPKEENYRTARNEPLNLLSLDALSASAYWNVMYAYAFDENSLFTRSLKNPPEYSKDLWNNPYFRELPIVSSQGFGTGASLAKLLSVLANGGIDGDRTILKPESLTWLNEPISSGNDLILLRNVTFGRGTVLREAPHGGWIYGHFGAGGQMAYADPKHGLAWTYVTSHHSIYALGDDPKYLALERAIYDSVDKVEKSQR